MAGIGTKDKVVGLGIVLVFLTALVSGVSNFVNFWVAKNVNVNSDAFVVARNVVVALLLVPLALLARRDVRARLRRADWAKLATIGLVGGAIPFLLFFRGIQMAAGAASATFGYRTLFLMATVLGVVVLKERLSRWTLLAAGLLLVGNALLLTLTGPVWTDGTLLVLLATGLWATEYTLSKKALRDLPSRTVALGRMGFGGAFLLAYVLASGQIGSLAGFPLEQLQWMALSAILLVAFVTTWYAGLKHVDLSTASAVLVLGFPITWALEVVAGRRPLTIPQAAGAVAVVLGVALAAGVLSVRETFEAAGRAVLAGIRRATGR